MRDFRDYVERKLGLLEVPSERKAEIVDEISEHMQAAYEEARERGATEQEALTSAESSFAPWDNLQRSLEQAESTPVAELSTS